MRKRTIIKFKTHDYGATFVYALAGGVNHIQGLMYNNGYEWRTVNCNGKWLKVISRKGVVRFQCEKKS